MSSGKSMSSSPKGSQNGSHSPLYLKNEQKNTNPSGNSGEIPIKLISKRAPEEGWWLRVKKEILKTLSYIGTEVNSVKNNTIICPIFVMNSFCFYEGMPNYQRVMATLNKVSKLRGNCQIDWISGETDKTKAKPNQRSNRKCRFIQGNKQGEHLLKREKCEGSEKTVEM